MTAGIKIFYMVIAVYLAILLFIIFGWQLVFAQDFDPCYVDNDMYQRVCDKQRINAVIDDMLNMTRQWNQEHPR